MTSYVNQTDLSELFGISFEGIDKILIEHELKKGELATQKAIDGGYAVLSTIPAPAPRNYWNPFKISELTGKENSLTRLVSMPKTSCGISSVLTNSPISYLGC